MVRKPLVRKVHGTPPRASHGLNRRLLSGIAAGTVLAMSWWGGHHLAEEQMRQHEQRRQAALTFDEKMVIFQIQNPTILDKILQDCPQATTYRELVATYPRPERLEPRMLRNACKGNLPITEVEQALAIQEFSSDDIADLVTASQASRVPFSDALRTAQIMPERCVETKLQPAHTPAGIGTERQADDETIRERISSGIKPLKDYVRGGGTSAFVAKTSSLRSPGESCPAIKTMSQMLDTLRDERILKVFEAVFPTGMSGDFNSAHEVIHEGKSLDTIRNYGVVGVTSIWDALALAENDVPPERYAAISSKIQDKRKAFSAAAFGALPHELALIDTPKPNALITIPLEDGAAFRAKSVNDLLASIRKAYDVIMVPTASQLDAFIAIGMLPSHSTELLVHSGHGSRTSLSYNDIAAEAKDPTIKDLAQFTPEDTEYESFFAKLHPKARILQLSCSNAANMKPIDFRYGLFGMIGAKGGKNLAETVKELAGPERVVFASKSDFYIKDVEITQAYPLELKIITDGKDVTWRK